MHGRSKFFFLFLHDSWWLFHKITLFFFFIKENILYSGQLCSIYAQYVQLAWLSVQINDSNFRKYVYIDLLENMQSELSFTWSSLRQGNDKI